MSHELWPDNERLVATAQRIRNDDETAFIIGEKIANLLYLKKDKEHSDRWPTTGGTKTNQGLARTVLRIMEEETQ